MSDAQQRIALVTGGAKRVGRAIVERLAKEGFGVAFTYLSSEFEAAELAKSVGGLAIHTDLTDPAHAIDVIQGNFGERFTRLDVLVNNASIYEPSSFTDTTFEQIRRLNAIHIQSPIGLCQTFAPLLRASKGSVINMVDLLAEKPWPKYLGYCASKAALANLTLGLARELAPDITVNAIAPGVVEWPDDFPETDRVKYLSRVPLARPGTPEDVANLVHFLCTEGKYITGQIIRLDGGRSIT